MHKRLQELTDYLAAVRAELAAELAATPLDRLARSPSPTEWSGVQIVQHLGKIEGSVTKKLEGMFAEALAAGFPADPDTSSVLGALDKYQLTGRAKLKLSAPQPFHPEPTPDFERNWQSLQAVRRRTLAAYATVDGRDLTRISFPHPFLGPLNAYEWMLLIGQHESRHLAQLREAAAV